VYKHTAKLPLARTAVQALWVAVQGLKEPKKTAEKETLAVQPHASLAAVKAQ
jgi:hypothetical protein